MLCRNFSLVNRPHFSQASFQCLKFLWLGGRTSPKKSHIWLHSFSAAWIVPMNITADWTSLMPMLWPCVCIFFSYVQCTQATYCWMILCQLEVINPSVRMSWITNNWEDHWTSKAARMIKALVSEFPIWIFLFFWLFQMEKYRTSSINSGGPTAEMQANATELALDGWHDFIADFEDELNDGKATFSRRVVTASVQQTVEEEYSTYVMGAPSSGTILDTLKF
jgi:hypothetical protein